MNEYDYYSMLLTQRVQELYCRGVMLYDKGDGKRYIQRIQGEINDLAKDGEITTRSKNQLLTELNGIYKMQLIIKNNK